LRPVEKPGAFSLARLLGFHALGIFGYVAPWHQATTVLYQSRAQHIAG
jgi:hypothetical protein